MKQFNTKVNCKGCQYELKLGFEAKSGFEFVVIPVNCYNCGSDLSVQVSRGLFKKNVRTKVSMVKHTSKLLGILKERQMNAINHSER